MKHIIFIAVFFVNTFSFAQDTGSISGQILDIESNNQPLLCAKITIKETGAKVLSDEKGLFKFENLKVGYYTLISSFVGYKTTEYGVKVIIGKTINLKFHLKAEALSVDDLILAIANADKENTSINK